MHHLGNPLLDKPAFAIGLDYLGPPGEMLIRFHQREGGWLQFCKRLETGDSVLYANADGVDAWSVDHPLCHLTPEIGFQGCSGCAVPEGITVIDNVRYRRGGS